jgi:predicted DNA-binding transcriptional regulator AlpA
MNPQPLTVSSLMDPAEVASYLRISTGAFRSMRSRGQFLPAAMISARKPRWETEDVVRWMKSRKEGRK